MMIAMRVNNGTKISREESVATTDDDNCLGDACPGTPVSSVATKSRRFSESCRTK